MAAQGSRIKRGLTIAGLLAVIICCWLWIYFTQFATPAFNQPLHQAVGQVMAEETVKLLDQKGKIIVLAVNPREFPELKAQLTSFTAVLKKAPAVTIKEQCLLKADDPKYGVGRGLSAKRLIQVMSKYRDADAVVSFIGTPNLTDQDLTQLAQAHPKFIAEVRSTERTLKLLDSGVLQLVVVPRFAFPPPGPKHPHSPREWFNRYFQVLTPATGRRGDE